MVDALLAMGADVNVKNHRGDTPLHWCIFTDNVNCARLLLMNKAKTNITGASNLTALELAENQKKLKCTRLLLMVSGTKILFFSVEMKQYPILFFKIRTSKGTFFSRISRWTSR